MTAQESDSSTGLVRGVCNSAFSRTLGLLGSAKAINPSLAKGIETIEQHAVSLSTTTLGKKILQRADDTLSSVDRKVEEVLDNQSDRVTRVQVEYKRRSEQVQQIREALGETRSVVKQAVHDPAAALQNVQALAARLGSKYDVQDVSTYFVESRRRVALATARGVDRFADMADRAVDRVLPEAGAANGSSPSTDCNADSGVNESNETNSANQSFDGEAAALAALLPTLSRIGTKVQRRTAARVSTAYRASLSAAQRSSTEYTQSLMSVAMLTADTVLDTLDAADVILDAALNIDAVPPASSDIKARVQQNPSECGSPQEVESSELTLRLVGSRIAGRSRFVAGRIRTRLSRRAGILAHRFNTTTQTARSRAFSSVQAVAQNAQTRAVTTVQTAAVNARSRAETLLSRPTAQAVVGTTTTLVKPYFDQALRAAEESSTFKPLSESAFKALAWLDAATATQA